MAKKIYYIKNDKLTPNKTTGHTGTPIRVIDEFEGATACKYQIEYLKMWKQFFHKEKYTQDWFEQVNVLKRQTGFYKKGSKHYTCEDTFKDCEEICQNYLQNSTRFKHIAVPAFDKVERAIEKGIAIVKKHEHPFLDRVQVLEDTQELTHIEWIKGPRPKTDSFSRLFDIEKTAETQLA